MQSVNATMPFIVGVGRSGTTLLRLMLDAHPDLSIPPETHFVPQLLQEKMESRDDFVKFMTGVATWRDFELNEEEPRLCLEGLRPFSISGGVREFYRLYARRFQKKYFGDKTPLYLSSMTLIAQAFPEARFIHLIRDGRDVAMSYRGLWFGPGEDASSAARFWMERINVGRQQACSLKYYHEVRYEELIKDASSVLKKICAFIDIPFSEQMLNYHNTSAYRLSELGDRFRDDGTICVKREDRMHIHALTHLPPDRSRIERWKSAMSETDQKLFERVAGKLLRNLGYETKYC